MNKKQYFKATEMPSSCQPERFEKASLLHFDTSMVQLERISKDKLTLAFNFQGFNPSDVFVEELESFVGAGGMEPVLDEIYKLSLLKTLLKALKK